MVQKKKKKKKKKKKNQIDEKKDFSKWSRWNLDKEKKKIKPVLVK